MKKSRTNWLGQLALVIDCPGGIQQLEKNGTTQRIIIIRKGNLKLLHSRPMHRSASNGMARLRIDVTIDQQRCDTHNTHLQRSDKKLWVWRVHKFVMNDVVDP